jgi:hypothetical protein
VSDENEVKLQDLDDEELLARMEGGFFSLLDGNEEYSELFRVAAALGIKQFVAERLKPYDREQLLDLFNDAEQVIHEFIRFAADRGLLEKVEQDLE